MKKIVEMDSLKDIITIRCDEYKDRVAFMEKDPNTREYVNIKYSKLKEDVLNLGTALLEKLKLENEKVAVIGENSYKWYITYMATICGVGIIVPLDKELPEAEILNLLQRSKAKCIVYSSRKEEVIKKLRNELPDDMVYVEMSKEKSDDESYSFDQLLKEGKELIDTGTTSYIDKKIDRDAFSALIFTSGTTAKSKGVMLCHRNLTANIYSAESLVPDQTSFRYISILPMHHTYEFMISYLNATANGSCVGICEGLKYISKNMKEIKPTIFVAVPLLVDNIVKKIEKALKETKKEKLINNVSVITNSLSKVGIDLRRIVFKKVIDNFGGNLKYIFSGAAPIDKHVVEKVESFGISLMQGYGLTETAPLVAGTPPNDRVSGTVGKPLKGVEVRIDLEENQTSGEIMVKGNNVMLGYYEDEEETKKVLKKGWIYTGDVGYFDDKGNLVISGRIKNVIVTKNGKKIFPEEMEFVINKIPIIKESLVYGEESKEDKTDVTLAVKVTLDEEYIEEVYSSNRPSDEELYNLVWKEIKKINREQVPYKVIKKLEIKKEDFSKTTTMKIKRFEEIKK